MDELIRDIINNEIEGDYYQFPAISSSRLKKWISSPSHFLTNLQKEATPAMDKGTALHCLILEEQLFNQSYVKFTKPFPGATMSKRENKEAKLKLIESGVIPVDVDFWDELQNMRNAINSHKVAESCFFRGDSINEIGLSWTHESGLACKIKPDRLKFVKDSILPIDLKKCVDASKKGFMKACTNYHYPLQAALYDMGLRACFPDKEIQPFHFIMIEEKHPHYLQHYIIEDWQIKVIQQWIDATLFKIADLIKYKHLFRSYSHPEDKNGGLIEIELPDYYLNNYSS